MKVILSKIIFRGVPRAVSVTYEAVLDVEERTVEFLAGLLVAERVRRGTRAGSRALEVREQAVLVLRWFLDDARMTALARDNAISVSTAYAYRDEGVAVLAQRRPSLRGALLAAKAAGHSHVIVDGTLIRTDRIATPGPTAGVDLWWSGKHRHHGGNVQVVAAPDSWPLWTSEVRPGREHDTTAARADPDLLIRIGEWVADGRPGLADLGYEGEPDIFTIPIKKPREQDLTVDQQTSNAVHGALRCLGERALPTQDRFHGAAPLPRLPVADRPGHRRRAGPAPSRQPSHHLIHNERSHTATTGYSERLSHDSDRRRALHDQSRHFARSVVVLAHMYQHSQVENWRKINASQAIHRDSSNCCSVDRRSHGSISRHCAGNPPDREPPRHAVFGCPQRLHLQRRRCRGMALRQRE
jgi:hypothetical protein